MTQEQKEQLAREGVTIVTNTKRVTHEDLYRIILWALNARDEEFALLKAEIEDDNAVMKQLKVELNKAKNPWVSVEERLPEKAIGLYELEEDEQHKKVLFKTANGRSYIGYLDAEEIWRAFTVPFKVAYPIDSVTWSRVTHWMPIPEGGEG